MTYAEPRRAPARIYLTRSRVRTQRTMLAAAVPLTARQIAARAAVPDSTVRASVVTLQRRGWIERTGGPRNRAEYLYAITPHMRPHIKNLVG